MKRIRNYHLRAERWKDVKGYEGLYQVSNFGRVKSLDRCITSKNGRKRIFKEKVLKSVLNKNTGYLYVTLCKDIKQKQYMIHRLVAEAFKPNLHNYPTVDHINRIRTDSKTYNLRWAPWELQAKNSDRSNRESQIKSISKPVQQYTLDSQFVSEYPSVLEAQRQTGICHVSIIQCCKNQKYRHTAGGYIWKYKD